MAADIENGDARKRMEGRIADHPPEEECRDADCPICAARDCPYGDPHHYTARGCPSCDRVRRHE
jgi:hypothetical protein